MIRPIRERLAVCSWSLQPADPHQLIEGLRAIGILRVQLALDPLREQPEWADTGALLHQAGIEIVSGMFGTVGEDYTSLDSIHRTGGLVPDATWEENWENVQANARLAHQLGLKLVTFHAGFLPQDEACPEFEKLQHRIRLVADVFAAQGIDLAFETGQETAQSLLGAYFTITGTHPLFSRWKKQNILFTLMVSLSMVGLHERRDRPPQRRLAEQNQPRQTFLFYRSHPSLRVCVQIRTPGWQLQRLYSPRLQHFSERFAEFGVAIMQKILAGVQASQFL